MDQSTSGSSTADFEPEVVDLSESQNFQEILSFNDLPPEIRQLIHERANLEVLYWDRASRDSALRYFNQWAAPRREVVDRLCRLNQSRGYSFVQCYHFVNRYDPKFEYMLPKALLLGPPPAPREILVEGFEHRFLILPTGEVRIAENNDREFGQNSQAYYSFNPQGRVVQFRSEYNGSEEVQNFYGERSIMVVIQPPDWGQAVIRIWRKGFRDTGRGQISPWDLGAALVSWPRIKDNKTLKIIDPR
jgi:hypothetical protein